MICDASVALYILGLRNPKQAGRSYTIPASLKLQAQVLPVSRLGHRDSLRRLSLRNKIIWLNMETNHFIGPKNLIGVGIANGRKIAQDQGVIIAKRKDDLGREAQMLTTGLGVVLGTIFYGGLLAISMFLFGQFLPVIYVFVSEGL